MRRNDMESGSPRGLPLSPRCHKGVLGYPGRLWRPFYRKICSLRCRQMYLLCPVFALRQPEYVSTAGINSRQKVKRKGREERRTTDLYNITIARKAPAFSSPSKTSSVQAVRLENLHPRDVSARLLAPVSSLKLDIRTATNSMTNAKVLTNHVGENAARRKMAMNIK